MIIIIKNKQSSVIYNIDFNTEELINQLNKYQS